jgi:hypothetical protein
LAYLPPYSPDLNPIEEAFAELKAWCKKHHKEAERLGLEDFLASAMENIHEGARGHFVRSQVGVPLRDGRDEDYWND